jgi:hypothetical protein
MILTPMKTMKMWIGNLDGDRQGLVIAPSKKRSLAPVEVILRIIGVFRLASIRASSSRFSTRVSWATQRGSRDDAAVGGQPAKHGGNDEDHPRLHHGAR